MQLDMARGRLVTTWRRRTQSCGRILVVGIVTTLMGGLFAGVGTTTALAAGATDSTVVLGDLCSCTGPEASTIAQTTGTLQAWVAYTNAHGGLSGHTRSGWR